MSRLILLLSVDLDIQEAFASYEDYQEGRGTLFLRHLEAAFDQLRLFPESLSRQAASPFPLYAVEGAAMVRA